MKYIGISNFMHVNWLHLIIITLLLLYRYAGLAYTYISYTAQAQSIHLLTKKFLPYHPNLKEFMQHSYRKALFFEICKCGSFGGCHNYLNKYSINLNVFLTLHLVITPLFNFHLDIWSEHY